MSVRSARIAPSVGRGTQGRLDRVIDPPFLSYPAGTIERMFEVDGLNPGAPLSEASAATDLDQLSGHDLIAVLQAHQRMASRHQAQVYAVISAVSDRMEVMFPDDPELAWQATSIEIGAALHLTRRAAEREVDLALSLKRRLPPVWNALLKGSIDQRRARVIADNLSHLDEATARSVADTVIEDAAGLTTGQLAARLRRLCIQANPDTAQQRYDQAVDQRRVVLEAGPDGTATLSGIDLSADKAVAAAVHIDTLAKALNREGDARPIDQLRADVFLDLITGEATSSSGRGGVVELTVDLNTLTELSESPGELAGYGPVIADIARQVAQAQVDGEWRFTITNPETGQPIHDGTTRRRPTTSQRRTVTARDRRCVFPGCRMPATQSDLDHRREWARHHRTSTRELAPLCRHHHHIARHRIGWTYQRLPNGDYRWTSPLGHHYTTSSKPP